MISDQFNLFYTMFDCHSSLFYILLHYFRFRSIWLALAHKPWLASFSCFSV